MRDLRASMTLLSSTACYERYADAVGRVINPTDVAEILMSTVVCKVYSRAFLIHVRRCIEVDNILPLEAMEVNPTEFHTERHIIVTCVASHVNQSMGLDTTLCGARVRGQRHGKCIVWW